MSVGDHLQVDQRFVRTVVGEAYRALAFARPRGAAAEVIASFTQHHRTREAVAAVLANGRRLLPELTVERFALADGLRVPRAIGDFLILLHSGYTKRAALLLNVLSSTAMVLGGVIAYFALNTMQEWVPPLLGLAVASMLYVSVADLIPGLHRRPELRATAQQVVLIGLGIATIWVVGEFSHFVVNGH